jgi:hypothetical protein
MSADLRIRHVDEAVRRGKSEVPLNLLRLASAAVLTIAAMTHAQMVPSDPNFVQKPLGPGPYRASGTLMEKQVLTKVEPVYPAKAKADGVSGQVVLHAIIGKDGRGGEAERRIRATLLTQAAIDAVRQWVYKPFQLRAQPVEIDTTIAVISRLPDSLSQRCGG